MVAQADRTQRRPALLIATSDYSDPALRQLRAPGRDASDLEEVLSSPQIGGFAVQTLINARCSELLEAIEDFCADRRLDDQLLIYLSCHGVLDDRGRLYYAATDTRRQRTAATAVAAAWLNERLEDCRARSQIVILDCCHSGAFASGAKGESDLALKQRFKPHGRGRIVLTASRGTEYSFEGDQPSGIGMQSVFTQAIVDGLRTGDADRDKNGLITVSEIYHYAYDRVRAVEPRQTPELWTYGAEGDVLLAYSVRGAIIEPIPLPEDLRLTLESPRPRIRETAVAELAELLDAARAGLVLSVRQALQRISDEDIPQVAAVARMALEASQGTAAREVRQELAERDQRARLSLEAEQAERRKAEERARLEAEQAERRKAEERARLEAEQAERRKAEERARWNATDKMGYASAQVNSAPIPTATRAVTGSGVGRVLWALVPVLSLGVLLPFPFAYAAARLHSRKLWVIAFPYAILWLILLIVIIVQGSLGHSNAALTASIWLLVSSVIAAVHALRLRLPEAELAARQKAEEQAHWNATDTVNGFERALASLAYLLPIIALITAFRRNSFIRINAIQALMLAAIGLVALVTIPAYDNPRPNVYTPAVSQPWFSILITLGITASCVSVILVLFCLFRVIQGRLPRIVLLTRMASRLAALVTRITE
jgi:Caspase domain